MTRAWFQPTSSKTSWTGTTSFVGQYILTDVRYVRYVGINNMHCMYWKSSKKFADEGRYHMADSMCINVPSVLVAMQLCTHTVSFDGTFCKTVGWLHGVPQYHASNLAP